MYKEFKFFSYFFKPIKFLNLIELTSLILFLGIYPKEIIRATKIKYMGLLVEPFFLIAQNLMFNNKEW